MLEPGTTVDSHFVHFDPVDSHLVLGRSGSVTFSDRILGVILTDDTLDGTDDQLGLSGTSYPYGLSYRGVEVSTKSSRDKISLSSDRRTLMIDRFGASNAVDQLRVVTVPEPASLALVGLGALAILGRRRRQTLSP